MSESLVIGSRGSQLALWQARWVQERLAALGFTSRIEIIRTTGDKVTDVPLAKVGGKGLFTKEIEEALLEGRIDCAVHSMKDLPTELPAGLTVAAVPEREEPFDALVGSTLAALPGGARVGTSSLRRAAQLRALRPDLVIESIRGNLDTRLRKLDEGQYAAIVLAAAGLKRLGWGDRIAEMLAPDVMVPAVGQGALAVETRHDGGLGHQACSRLDHPPSRLAVTAERAVLAGLGGGCQVPIGAHAVVVDERVTVRAVVIAPDGSRAIHAEKSGAAQEATTLGDAIAAQLLDGGARSILREVYGPLTGRRVVVTRARQQAGELSARLRQLGAEVIELPVIDFAPPENDERLRAAVAQLNSYDWLIFTSVNGVEFFFRRVPDGTPVTVKVCAIGPATAEALRRRGLAVDLVPAEYVAESVVAAFADVKLHEKRILLPRAAVARDLIPAELRKLGAVVDVVEAYRNVVPEGLSDRAREVFAAAAKPDWVTLTSSSTVKNLLAAAGPERLAGVRIASIGPVTSQEARMHGLTITVEAEPYTIDGLVDAMCRTSIS